MKLPESYKPSEDEEYMNPMQLEYFRAKLVELKESLIEQSQKKTLVVLENKDENDSSDMASWEHGAGVELKTGDRYRKMIREVDDALERIKDYNYGYCEETGDEIGLARLEVNMMTLYCIEEQERREREKKIYNISEEEE